MLKLWVPKDYIGRGWDIGLQLHWCTQSFIIWSLYRWLKIVGYFCSILINWSQKQMIINKITPYVDYQIWLKNLYNTCLVRTIQNSMKVPKFLSQITRLQNFGYQCNVKFNDIFLSIYYKNFLESFPSNA